MHYARGDTIVRVKNETMSKIGCYFSKMCTYHKEKKRKKWSNGLLSPLTTISG